MALRAVEGRHRRTFLFAFLDDMSRLVAHAQFYVSEALESYLDALRQALLRRGLPGGFTSTMVELSLSAPGPDYRLPGDRPDSLDPVSARRARQMRAVVSYC